jgi:hypothetical protein
MTSRDFCYWLQGFYELNGDVKITEGQTKVIRKHLNMVFKHEIDPSFGDDNEALNTIHQGPPPPQQPTTPFNPIIRC